MSPRTPPLPFSPSPRASRRLLATLALVLSLPACRQGEPIGVVRPPPALRVDSGALSFLVVGDWGRRGSHNQRRVAEAMDSTARALGADFVVSTGDNFYPNGVTGVGDDDWSASFEDVYTGRALQTKWYAVLGNHDYRGDPQAQVDYSARSRRWHLPSRYYAVRERVDDSTSVELFFLDTNPFIADYRRQSWRYDDLPLQDTIAQKQWLDSALVASTATWKLVVGHHHIYSGGRRETNEYLALWLVPLMERRGVAAYISGHEHVLQHVHRPLERVHYFISGAGSEIRIPGNALGTRYSEGRQGFMAVSVLGRHLVVQAIDFTGAVRYAVDIER